MRITIQDFLQAVRELSSETGVSVLIDAPWFREDDRGEPVDIEAHGLGTLASLFLVDALNRAATKAD